MRLSLLKGWFRATALAGAVSVTALAPANAVVIITGAYDPVYGLPFSGTNGSMYWAGTANFVFDNNCTLPTNGTIDTAVQTTCGMTVEQAVVGLYTANPTNGGSKFATLTFAGAANIALATFSGGNLTGVYSDYFDPWQTAVLANTGVDPFNVSAFAFNLAFSLEGATLFHDALAETADRHKNHVDRGVFWNGKGYGHLKDSYCAPDRQTVSTATCGYSQNIATVTFSPLAVVPEPGSVPLILAGLLTLTLATRVRRRG
jgi:hypothetical protein